MRARLQKFNIGFKEQIGFYVIYKLNSFTVRKNKNKYCLWRLPQYKYGW